MVCLVFLMIFDFAFNKPEIALAKNTGKFVVSLFENGFTVYTNSNADDTVMEETITEYASIEEFVEAGLCGYWNGLSEMHQWCGHSFLSATGAFSWAQC